MITLEKVALGYAGLTLWRDFSFVFPDEGAFSLMGPSGCGKTTLLRALGGILKPLEGKITIAPACRPTFLFQENRLLQNCTALQNVALASNEKKARIWLERMEIADVNQYPDEMSGGMQRRVALARALARGGNIFLLDEPFQGLDQALRARVAEAFQAPGRLIVMTSHDPEEAVLMKAQIMRCEAWQNQDALREKAVNYEGDSDTIQT